MSFSSPELLDGDGQAGGWCWVTFRARRPAIWAALGQGLNVLAVDAGEGCLDIFSLISHFSSCFSLGYGPVETEILSQRAVKPTNQPRLIGWL